MIGEVTLRHGLFIRPTDDGLEAAWQATRMQVTGRVLRLPLAVMSNNGTSIRRQISGTVRPRASPSSATLAAHDVPDFLGPARPGNHADALSRPEYRNR
ncbi:hypothetical protein [Thermaurantiacus tibetensis]|uniref:hypothetical protein n=1 Tax=Thermaurantiacus tibetensis TaxID=2759035 RepID=UPI00189009A8|nr:hypothetical protein [Thermaurantiacus tibetensis]